MKQFERFATITQSFTQRKISIPLYWKDTNYKTPALSAQKYIDIFTGWCLCSGNEYFRSREVCGFCCFVALWWWSDATATYQLRKWAIKSVNIFHAGSFYI